MLNLRHASYSDDFSAVDPDCKCTICRPSSDGGLGLTRAYIHHVAAKETAGAHLLSIHNVHYLLDLMRSVREAIIADRYPAFLREYFATLYARDKKKYPGWVVEALKSVGVDLMQD